MNLNTLKADLTRQREQLSRQQTGLQKSLEKIDAKLELITQLEATKPATRASKPRKPNNPKPKKPQTPNS